MFLSDGLQLLRLWMALLCRRDGDCNVPDNNSIGKRLLHQNTGSFITVGTLVLSYTHL